MRAAPIIACVLSACGARSELDVDDASVIDASPDLVTIDHVTPPTEDAGSDVTTSGCAPTCEGTCESGRCIIVLAKGPATELAVDDTSIYWTNAGVVTDTGTVSQVAKTGGTPQLLLFDLAFPRAIAVDATRVYVGTVYAMWTVPIGGGAPSVFVPWTLAAAIAVDQANVYWTNYGANTVMSAPKDGGAPITIATNQSFVQGIAIDSNRAYWAVPGTEPTGYTDGWIATAPLDGGATMTLASNQLLPDSIAVAGGRLYWSDYHPTAGVLSSAAIDGSAFDVLAASQTYPNHVVTDGTSVYWTTLGSIDQNYVDGAVQKMPLGGGPITTIATAQVSASAVVVDADSAYWVAGGAIMKATPK